MEKLNELSESTGRNVIYVVKGIFECNGKEKTFYYNKSLDNWSEYLVNPDPTQLGNATQFKNVPKDETLEVASDAANNRKCCAVRFEDPDYELVDIIILELKKSRYGFSKVSQRSWLNGKHESLSESSQLFENGNLFDYVLNESSLSLKESERSLEWLLDKAYVSEYRMVGKNSAEVRVRHTPELLTSESMAARFGEDIPDGYKLEVDFLGEDPILGRNFDIYEVQLLREGTNNKILNEGKFVDKVIPTLIGIGATAGIAAPLTGLAIHQNKSFDRLVDNLGLELSEKANQPDGASCFVNAIKDFKYDGKISKEYGMDIDGLCDYLYDYSNKHFSVTGDGLDISYEDCGDYYLISYEGEYVMSIGNPKCLGHKNAHAEDSFKISKDYFGTQFILDEAIVAQAKRLNN